ncbi:siderophore-interacting protein [Streptomyces sp. RFCAC02]|uniref:siderophore-interacting protein n=1 Tax=Streptomyces sp. RFCAC02 TaxID=2499143 RepID=UPI00101FC595|nr:siderophore-interacting protein [Streptomyces sp. RFCAC02]
MTVTDRSDPRGRVADHLRSGSGVVRIPYPIGIRTLTLLNRTEITPCMLRLTLGGPGLDGFHSYQADDHIRIVFPDPDGTLRVPVPNDRQMLDWPRPFPITRQYTVRRWDPDTRELDLDFVLHDGGVASEWARRAAIGEDVIVAGPPGAKVFPLTYDHYILAVDATGLPAAARWLEEAGDDISADLVVETDEAVEHDYPLPERAGVTVHRLIRDGRPSALADTVTALPLPAGRVLLFAAGEADDIKPLRAWHKDRTDASFTGYWKRGVAGLDD